jgi:hypothetical protein
VGKLTTDKEMTIELVKADGMHRMRTVETKGEAVLTYADAAGGQSHTLKCYGKIKLDNIKRESQLHSPKDNAGNVLEGKQVYFEDEKGQISADRAFIKYDEVEGKIKPARIVLEGNVRIVNLVTKSKDDSELTQQYILADRVDFIPATQEMIFKADKGKRVLLYDKNNNMEVSAPGLKLVRDHAANKEALRAIGGVRLNFVEDELEQLKSHFMLDRWIHGKGKE